MNPEDQTEEAFSENYDFAPEGDTKGMDYATLLVDNIIGIDNGYESFGESLGKKINEDELGFLRETAVGAYEGAKEFVTSPIDTTSQMISDITDSVSRLGTESLDGRLKSMFNVGYQEATDEQVNKAREAVIGDAVMVSGFIPAAKGVTSVAKAAIPGKVKATIRGKPLNTSVDDIINAEDFEPLDEAFIPINKPSAESLKSEIDYMLGEELTPQEGLSKIKKTNLEDLGLYKKGTALGDTALDKDKIFSSLKDEELLKLAEDLPHWEDAKYEDYLKNTLVPVSKEIGAHWSNFLETINDISSYLPTKENPQLAFLTEKPLPRKAPVGERAATGSAPRAADPMAEQLGFLDTVYHTSVSPQEFTEFDLQKGFGGEVRAAQDLLGVHVGTARAAAERNFQAYRKDDTPKGFTMELRARATDPLTKGDLAGMLGKAPEDIFSSGDTPLTESDIGEAISLYEDMLFKDKQPPKEARKIAAVAFRRELAREGFTHIPYINSVEDPGSISYIMLVDRPKDSPAVLRDVRAQFNPKKITSPDLRFAEGGVVEEQQMNRLFQEGGIADDGMSREPVTGNEIPPGSMASEVRDDIPTQLSEGEYVVPADVLRYYGVRFFEDLRAQAKQGMMEMEADGRIGGVPVNAQGVPSGGQEDALTPEEEQMLMEALGSDTGGMAMGGYVDQQPLSTPYQDQATMYQAPVTNGMAKGGTTFDRTQFSSGTAGVGIEAKKYINPKTGETRTFNFIGTTALGIIPEDFVPWTQSLADQAAENTKDTSVTEQVTGQKGGEGKDRERGLTGTDESGLSKSQQEAMAADPFSFGMDALGGIKSDGMLDKLSMAPGLVGIAASLANKAVDANAISKAEKAIASMNPTDPNYGKLAEALTAAGGTVPTPSTAPTAPAATSAGVPSAPSASGDKVTGGVGTPAVNGNTANDRLGGGSAPSTGGSSGYGAGSSAYGGGGRDAGGASSGPSSSGAPSGSTSGTGGGGADSGGKSAGVSAGYGGYGGAAEPGKVGPQARGGLIPRVKKTTTRKTKGLAGK